VGWVDIIKEKRKMKKLYILIVFLFLISGCASNPVKVRTIWCGEGPYRHKEIHIATKEQSIFINGTEYLDFGDGHYSWVFLKSNREEK
jgi:hypothetical protein